MPLLATLTAGNLKGWGPKPDEKIMVTAVRHEVVNPVNPTDGSRDSKRLHSPLTVTKRIDQSTPFFHEHQTLGNVISPFELRFIHNPPKGKAQNYVTIRLEDARVIGIKTVMPRNSDPPWAMVHEFEEISFAYSKISWIEEKVKDTEGDTVFQTGKARGSDDKDSGLAFFPDWVEEQARVAGLKMLAELEQLGVKYGDKMYEDLLKKLQEPPPKPK